MSQKGQQLKLLLRAGLLELARRQGIQVLCLLMSLYLLIALGARSVGERSLEADSFMLNLGLTLSVSLGLILAALTGLRQMPDDIENRSIYPLLARPLDRDTLLSGRFLSAALSGISVTLIFLLLTLIVSPTPSIMNRGMLIQYLLLQPLAIAWAAAFALLLGLCLPRALATLSCLGLIFGGEFLFRILPDLFIFKHLIPRFGSLQLATRVTSGATALSPAEWIPLLLYPAVWLCICHFSCRSVFRRKAL